MAGEVTGLGGGWFSTVSTAITISGAVASTQSALLGGAQGAIEGWNIVMSRSIAGNSSNDIGVSFTAYGGFAAGSTQFNYPTNATGAIASSATATRSTFFTAGNASTNMLPFWDISLVVSKTAANTGQVSVFFGIFGSSPRA